MSETPLTAAGTAQVPAAPSRYRGRFAPSPTGLLHFGSLITALGSYLCARHVGGEWRLRIEDLDPPRELVGAADAILRTLETHGLEWDGSVLYQSRRAEAYEAALARLWAGGWLYECSCTRSDIARFARQGPFGPIYPGRCRQGPRSRRKPYALRVLTHPRDIAFDDRLQGTQVQCLTETAGDFVVRRADGLYAYQLAVVVDDATQGITDIVRGADLLDSTPRQIHLQQLLGYPTASYLHLPVAVNAAGEKLSKQTHAPPLDSQQAGDNLWQALCFLSQQPPPELRRASPRELLAWAVSEWRVTAVAPRRSITLPNTPSQPTKSSRLSDTQ